MGALPKILQTRWLEFHAWSAGTASLPDPVTVRTYFVTWAEEDREVLQVTLLVHEPLERLALRVRPAFLPAIRLSREGPAGPWEEGISWGACAAGARLHFWARREDGDRWRGAPAAPPAGDQEGTDREAAWFTDEHQAGRP